MPGKLSGSLLQFVDTAVVLEPSKENHNTPVRFRLFMLKTTPVTRTQKQLTREAAKSCDVLQALIKSWLEYRKCGQHQGCSQYCPGSQTGCKRVWLHYSKEWPARVMIKELHQRFRPITNFLQMCIWVRKSVSSISPDESAALGNISLIFSLRTLWTVTVCI